MKNSCAPLSINWDEMAAIECLPSSAGRHIAYYPVILLIVSASWSQQADRSVRLKCTHDGRCSKAGPPAARGRFHQADRVEGGG
jgi:hypothetical protein